MSRYRLAQTRVFKKDLRTAIRRGYNIDLLGEVIDTLASSGTLPDRYRDHALSGNYKGCRECHIQPDWLLVYRICNENLVLYLMRTGTHSDLF